MKSGDKWLFFEATDINTAYMFLQKLTLSSMTHRVARQVLGKAEYIS